MSANRINIGREAYSLDYDDSKGAYTKVRIIFEERAEPVEVGTDDGRVLEISNPWAEPIAEQMAQDILTRIQGYEYQPFDAHGAFLPDNTELGDAVVVGGVYGAIVSQDITFDGLGNSDVSAPNGEDNENEFGDYVPSGDDPIKRELGRIRTEFIVAYDSITASVTDLTNDMGQTLRIAADGVTITNAQGSVLEIDGGQLKANSVTADEINVSTLKVGSGGITVDGGAISWSNLDSATQGSITTAVSNSSTAITNANSALGTVNQWVYPSTTYIDGSKIMTGTVRAQNLYGGNCQLYYSIYSEGEYTDYVRGGFILSDTSTGIGVNLYSNSGLQLTAGTNSNVYISAGAGARVSVEDGIGFGGNFVAFPRGNCWGTASPLNNSAIPAINGGVYFQIVS